MYLLSDAWSAAKVVWELAAAQAADVDALGVPSRFKFPTPHEYDVLLEKLPDLPEYACPSVLQAILCWLLNPEPSLRLSAADGILALRAALYGPGYVGLGEHPSIGGSFEVVSSEAGPQGVAPVPTPGSQPEGDALATEGTGGAEGGAGGGQSQQQWQSQRVRWSGAQADYLILGDEMSALTPTELLPLGENDIPDGIKKFVIRQLEASAKQTQNDIALGIPESGSGTGGSIARTSSEIALDPATAVSAEGAAGKKSVAEPTSDDENTDSPASTSPSELRVSEGPVEQALDKYSGSDLANGLIGPHAFALDVDGRYGGEIAASTGGAGVLESEAMDRINQQLPWT